MYYLSDLYEGAGIFKSAANREYLFPLGIGEKANINILALGDVGGILLTGLVLLGGKVINKVGIFDINKNNIERYEAEMNQIAYPCKSGLLPETVAILDEDELFHCDVFVFCASKGVPAVNSGVSDVRMAQYEGNRKIVEHYAKLAALKSFAGVFAVVSDPVDPLCKAAYMMSGLSPGQFRGFGLGIMNARALYYAQKEKKFARYATEGRAFGPHGQDLVIADSILNYNNDISRELTQKVVTENIRIRQMGFKPFMAPALSSGALSILSMLKGEWHYSSNYIGDGPDGAFFGALNRITDRKTEIENVELPEKLFERIQASYGNLRVKF
ncbi:MAG: lactate dehydrogenase [Spirochaetes bacterium]|nr:lactate dehydrogenase [Spirochaetota bacterium]